MHDPVRPRTGLLYAAGDLGPSATLMCLAFFWLYFLIDVVGLPPAQAGVLHGSGFLVSAVATLYAGDWLDHRATTAGARMRVVATLGLGLAAAFAALWIVLPPSRGGLAAYTVLWWAFQVIYAFVYLAYVSVTPLLAASVPSRVALNGYRFAGTMLVSLLVLGVFAVAADAGTPRQRLQALGVTVALLTAAGGVTCGLGLGRLVGARSMDVPASPVAWRDLAASPVIRWAVGGNLAVWLMVQAVMVLTAFLSASAGLSAPAVLFGLQFTVVAGTAAASPAARRLTPEGACRASALLWCAGAALWASGRAPWAAVLLLGPGLGTATVLSWARMPEALDAFAREGGRRADARAYVGVTLCRDLVSAAVPMTVGLALEGRAVGSPEAGLAAAALLVVVAGASALGLEVLRRPAPRTHADPVLIESRPAA